MSAAFVVSGKGAGDGTNASCTIDTTGVTLVVVKVTSYHVSAQPTISDSEGHTWTALTSYNDGSVKRVRMYYAYLTSTSATHTFTCTGGGFPTIYVEGFSGADSSGGFDQESGAGESTQPGSITPSVDGCIVVSVINTWTSGDNPTIDSGFTRTQSEAYSAGVRFAGGSAYKIQTTAAAINPAWSVSGTVAMAVFKPSSAATYTATSALTAAPATTAISATSDPPTFSASAALAAAPTTLSAAGTTDPPTFSGTAALVAAPATLAAEGTTTPPVFSGTAALAAGPATSSSTGTATPPTFTATAALSAAAAVLAASATYGTASAVFPSGGLIAREGYVLRAREGYALTVREGYALRAREG